MCSPTAVMIAGQAMQYMAQKQAVDRGERERRRVEDRTDRYTDQGLELNRENMRQYAPEQRQANRQAAEDRAVESLSAALEAGQGQPGKTTEGRVSDAYLERSAARTLEEANLATAIARRMAKVRAPGDLRFREGLEDAQYSAQVGRVANDRGNMWRAGQVDIERAAQPDPRLMFLGAGMSGYGQGKALVGGGGTVTPTTTMAARGARYGAFPKVPQSLFR